MPRRCEMNAATSAPASAAASDRPGEVEPEIGPRAQLQQSERVGADAEERAVPERRQAGVAEQQVVAHRVDHEDRDLEREVLVEPDARQPQRRVARISVVATSGHGSDGIGALAPEGARHGQDAVGGCRHGVRVLAARAGCCSNSSKIE